MRPTLPASADAAAVLTVAEMGAADRAAMAAGVSGLALMEAAGLAVALEAMRLAPRPCAGPVVVLCGPGNNGGDGFVAARTLQRRGWPVRLALLGSRERLTGDAAEQARRWRGGVEPLSVSSLAGASLVIDALFGAGLDRPLSGVAAEVVAEINARALPCLAVDVPSGVLGDSGVVLNGLAPCCRSTVTFFRPKPGHLLYPGRAFRGQLRVVDIGIPESVLTTVRSAPPLYLNGPALWRLPPLGAQDHKYSRGHGVAVGGERMSGAARLACRAARRVGAGLVTVLAPDQALPLYAGEAAGLLVAPLATFLLTLDDPRCTGWLIGPGLEANEETRRRVETLLAARRPVVLDAGALTAFAPEPERLFSLTRECPAILTPHEGEFSRLFEAGGGREAGRASSRRLRPAPEGRGEIQGSRLDRARLAAARSGAVVVLKGADTVVADPSGVAALSVNAPPSLATAGSGDVLAGLCLGLLAQGLPPFSAACAAVWLHGEAARLCTGPGLIAEDLPDRLPTVLQGLSTPRAIG